MTQAGAGQLPKGLHAEMLGAATVSTRLALFLPGHSLTLSS